MITKDASRSLGDQPWSLRALGAQLVKEVASKTSDVAGDGDHRDAVNEATFTAGLRAITAGAAPARLNQALRDGAAAITAELDKNARGGRPTRSARSTIFRDPETGKLIADAMERSARTA
jgi:chaperonin GroEL